MNCIKFNCIQFLTKNIFSGTVSVDINMLGTWRRMGRNNAGGDGKQEQEGGGELPGVVELGRANELDVAVFTFFDRELTLIPEDQEVKATTVAQINDEGLEDGLPQAGALPAVEALVTNLPGG